MPLQIIHQDITTVRCDAIVNPTDCFFSGSGGTDLAVHRAAGPELAEACAALDPIGFSEVAVTPGFNLPCRYVLHTMGPVWQGGGKNEAALLRGCYINALIKAEKLKAGSVAFPLISSGTFGFPKDKVLRIAVDAISDFLFTAESEPEIFICILNRDAYVLNQDSGLKEYLEREKNPPCMPHAIMAEECLAEYSVGSSLPDDDMLSAVSAMPCFAEEIAPAPCEKEKLKPLYSKPQGYVKDSLEEIIRHHDDSFAVLLLKLIDKKEMNEVECYKKANVSKNTFWKINNDPKYRPSKPTVLAFAIALELTIDETNRLLRSAGFALSGNNDFDLIIEYYITNGIYDIFEINAALYQYDQVCLGC